jgi:hypothetical protein
VSQGGTEEQLALWEEVESQLLDTALESHRE